MGKTGIIGGSGLYNIEGIKNVRKIAVTTPFGRPSDKFITGKLEGREVVFLPRHGIGHRISTQRNKLPGKYLRDEKTWCGKDHFRNRMRKPARRL